MKVERRVTTAEFFNAEVKFINHSKIQLIQQNHLCETVNCYKYNLCFYLVEFSNPFGSVSVYYD